MDSEQPTISMPPPVLEMSKDAPSDSPGASDGQPVAESAEQGSANNGVIWQGTTWDACPIWLGCLAPVFCMTTKWSITQSSIDIEHGCCGGKLDTIAMSRVRDLSLDSNCCVRAWCCGRGSVIIHSNDASHPVITLTTFHSKALFKNLKAVTSGNTVPTVMMQSP